jgi:3-deoxy-7-phosphoheptulonate synthase
LRLPRAARPADADLQLPRQTFDSPGVFIRKDAPVTPSRNDNTPAPASTARPWSPESWRTRPAAQEVRYHDEDALAVAVEKLRSLPPLVTSWEIERLRENIAGAQAGKRFLLQGGDCAESLDDCQPAFITNKLKILLQMSLVLVHGGMKPVIRVGRFAGQYAKPRSAAEETATGADGVERTLPSYFGDLVNRPDFDEKARKADPTLLVQAYEHAAMTINFIRALTAGGFADLHHPEYWDLGFLSHADLPADIRAQYEQTTSRLADALRFMEALGETSVDELTRVEFFTSHEGLNLVYESAQTRTVPRRDGYYDLTTHMPWIGERTRDITGAHVEFFRGIRNPVGVKLGPSASPEDVVDLCHALNPTDEPGRLVLICRMGAQQIAGALPSLINAVQRANRRVLWVCDPMHANTIKTAGGVKTRNFDEIIREIEQSFDIHDAAGSHLGGVHFELTGEDVTECVGGAAGVTEHDLDRNYTSRCDPRLNYSQSLEMAFRIAARMRK